MICNDSQYCILFWTPELAYYQREENLVDKKVEDHMIYQLDVINDFDDYPVTKPTVYCNYTNWRPQELVDLKTFCYSIDQSKPDFLKEMFNEGLKEGFSKKEKTIEQLSEPELKYYQSLLMKHKEDNYNTL